jgi:hypothetical protein
MAVPPTGTINSTSTTGNGSDPSVNQLMAKLKGGGMSKAQLFSHLTTLYQRTPSLATPTLPPPLPSSSIAAASSIIATESPLLAAALHAPTPTTASTTAPTGGSSTSTLAGHRRGVSSSFGSGSAFGSSGSIADDPLAPDLNALVAEIDEAASRVASYDTPATSQQVSPLALTAATATTNGAARMNGSNGGVGGRVSRSRSPMGTSPRHSNNGGMVPSHSAARAAVRAARSNSSSPASTTRTLSPSTANTTTREHQATSTAINASRGNQNRRAGGAGIATEPIQTPSQPQPQPQLQQASGSSAIPIVSEHMEDDLTLDDDEQTSHIETRPAPNIPPPDVDDAPQSMNHDDSWLFAGNGDPDHGDSHNNQHDHNNGGALPSPSPSPSVSSRDKGSARRTPSTSLHHGGGFTPRQTLAATGRSTYRQPVYQEEQV